MTWTDRCWIPLLDHAQGSCLLALSCRVTNPPFVVANAPSKGALRSRLACTCQTLEPNSVRPAKTPGHAERPPTVVIVSSTTGHQESTQRRGSMLEEGPPRGCAASRGPDVAPFYYRETRMWTRITPTVTRGWEADGVRSQGRDLGTGLGWGSLGSRRFPATSTEAAGFRSQRGSSRRHRGHAASFKPGRSFPPKISQTWHHHRFPSRRKLPR